MKDYTIEIKELLMDIVSMGIYEDEGELYDYIGGTAFPFDVSFSCGVSKMCLIFKKLGFVIKWGYDNPNKWIHSDVKAAAREFTNYCSAKIAHLKMFFPKTELFMVIDDIEFFKQTMVDDSIADLDYYEEKRYYKKYCSMISDRIIKRYKSKLSLISRKEINTLWVMMAEVMYGKKIMNALCDFLTEYGINDLHDYNIGIHNGRPVILDFSGYIL